MKVKITILPAVNSGEDLVEYVASCPEDCDGATDRSVYDSVVRHGATIAMGCVIGEPANDADRYYNDTWGDRWPGE